jgi:putative acetyltransferase
MQKPESACLSPVIRFERPDDLEAIRSLVASAFPTDAEARLVSTLRAAGRLTVSLVAEIDGAIVGHVAFSPVSVERGRGGEGVRGEGLAPLAVAERHRRRGIGERLVRAGIEACRADGVGFIVVLGEPEYYGRFGFVPARLFHLADEYGGGDAFQVLELRPDAVPVGGGTMRYAPEFSIFG